MSMQTMSQQEQFEHAKQTTTRQRLGDDDRGEGVISMAIAILIIAFIGALMFVGLNTMWQDTEAKTTSQLDSIGGTVDG